MTIKLKEMDKIIGDRVMGERLAHGLARRELAEHLGISHQQLAKYEKGTNRISAACLLQIAEILNVNITEFYKQDEVFASDSTHKRMCLELNKNFMRISNVKYQELVNDLVKNMAIGENLDEISN